MYYLLDRFVRQHTLTLQHSQFLQPPQSHNLRPRCPSVAALFNSRPQPELIDAASDHNVGTDGITFPLYLPHCSGQPFTGGLAEFLKMEGNLHKFKVYVFVS